MTKNIKKLLVCILVTLTITSFVFSCCKEIGLAANSDSDIISFNGNLPLIYGYGIGNVNPHDDSWYQIATDNIITWYNSVSNTPWSDSYSIIFSNGFYGWDVGFIIKPYSNGNGNMVNVGSSGLSPNSVFWVNTTTRIQLDSNSGSVAATGDIGDTAISLEHIIESSPSGEGYVFITNSSVDVLCYPAYIYNPENLVNSDGNIVFSKYTIPTGPTGHTKGGVLSNYVDSDDLLENSSDLPKVDTSAPTDSSSIPNWLQKILNGIGRVNQSIQGGFLTIGDYIGSTAEKIGEWIQNAIDSIEGFFGRVLDKLDEFIDTIKGLADGSTVQMAKDEWATQFENSIFQDFLDIRTTIEDDILTPIKNINAPSSLSLTIPLIKVNVPRLISSGGHVSSTSDYIYLFGQSVTLDFSWYTQSISGGVFNGSSIRDFIVPVIATFLYVGMIVSLLFKIPSFLNGASGFTNLVHSGIEHNGQQFAPTSHGIFTTGVSSHQPSLEKNPISGGSFRFWNF